MKKLFYSTSMRITSSDLINKLREIRKSKKMSSTVLAKRVGVTQGYISQIENGKTQCSLKMFLKICTVLEINLAVLPNDSDLSKTDLATEEKMIISDYRNSPQNIQDAIQTILKTTKNKK